MRASSRPFGSSMTRSISALRALLPHNHCPRTVHVSRSLRVSPSWTAIRRCGASHSRAPHRGLYSVGYNASVDEWQRFNSSGLSYLSSGQLDKAEQQFISAMRSAQLLVQDNKQETSVPLYLSLSNLSTAQRLLGKTEEAKRNAQWALDEVQRLQQIVGIDVIGHLHRELGLTCEQRGDWQQAVHSFTQAEACYADRIRQLQQQQPQPAAAVASSSPPASSVVRPQSSLDSVPELQKEQSGCLFAIALMLEKLQSPQAAIPFYRQAAAVAAAAFGPNSVNTAEAHVALGKLLLSLSAAGAEGDDLRRSAGEELMAALEIYQAREDPKLLQVLPLYMKTLGVASDMVQQLLREAKQGAGAGSDSSSPQAPGRPGAA